MPLSMPSWLMEFLCWKRNRQEIAFKTKNFVFTKQMVKLPYDF
jgi:hypothetical protein